MDNLKYEKNCEYAKKYRESHREKQKAYCKNWYKENKEKQKEYALKNKDAIKKRMKKWLEENKERIKARHKEYCIREKKQIRKKSNEYKEKNRESILEYRKLYLSNNLELFKKYNHKRKSTIRNLKHTLTLEQWEQIKAHFGNRCAYCGEDKKLEQEHFIPLCNNGEYTIKNIIPSCRSCNSSKNKNNFIEWYQSYKFYDRNREQAILNYIEGHDELKKIRAKNKKEKRV